MNAFANIRPPPPSKAQTIVVDTFATPYRATREDGVRSLVRSLVLSRRSNERVEMVRIKPKARLSPIRQADGLERLVLESDVEIDNRKHPEATWLRLPPQLDDEDLKVLSSTNGALIYLETGHLNGDRPGEPSC